MALIGIMGGTFNPIHIGHIKIAQAAFTQYHLDEVWFMPNHIPGYKSRNDLLSGEHRLAMVKLAIAKIPYFAASDYELRQPGNTYTAETLKGLTSRYREHRFYFIMGADSLSYFDKWKHPEAILECAKILVAPREDEDMSALTEQISMSNSEFGGEFFYPISCPLIPCSSREIRAAFHAGEERGISTVKTFLNADVYSYITGHHLYS